MECDSSKQNAQGPASRTRSRRKRKLKPLQQVASTSSSPTLKQGYGKSRHEDHQANSDQRVARDKDSAKHEKQDLWSTLPSKSWLPEKRVLELILDILQRRDTHEIFAEPVDPEEVEDYYEIIKEPMDFGTMRAKLHEGMYRSFEQFEHDVFLITKNAMHFNSSTTIYFRQARAINELATKIFHALKTHPESFELEFLESRQRSRKRRQSEAGNTVRRPRPKTARNVKATSMAIDESSKYMSCSLSASPNIRRCVPVRTGCSDFDTYLDARDWEVPCGDGDGGNFRSIEADRHCTYEPCTSSLDEDESIISAVSSNRKQLELVIQPDISYRESLMLFAKDLGPVVQTIARQKFLGGFPAQKSQFSMTFSSKDSEPSSVHTNLTASICQNFLDQVPKHPSLASNSRSRLDLEGDNEGEKMNLSDKMDTTRLKVKEESDTNSPSVCFSHKLHQNQSSGSQLRSSRDSTFSFSGFTNAGNKSTTVLDNVKLDIKPQKLELAFDHSKLNSTELESKSMDTSNFSHFEVSMSKSNSCYLGEDNHAGTEQGPFFVVSSSCEVGQAMTLDRCKTSTSQFILNLPYLRAQLGQTNSLGQDSFLQQNSGTQVTLLRNK